ncbi:hypothetical protein AVEN_15699-1 [Araneus ventricosus]|uniref:RING-type domain-containing protein n=1 Tax=Araneus ventricosus TaxID=182803 RepID=A0A4Y2JP48_ARAVE|nr:hypothetical protein AVEN_15699-1 [Araneus ventricosus]
MNSHDSKEEQVFNKGESCIVIMKSNDSKVEHVSTKKENCFICLEDYDKKSASFLPCSHSFHPQCIEGWLGKKNSCPVCRTKVNNNITEVSSDSFEDLLTLPPVKPYFYSPIHPIEPPYFGPPIHPIEPPYFFPPIHPMEPYIIPIYPFRRNRLPMIYYNSSPRMFSETDIITHRHLSPLQIEFSDV